MSYFAFDSSQEELEGLGSKRGREPKDDLDTQPPPTSMDNCDDISSAAKRFKSEAVDLQSEHGAGQDTPVTDSGHGMAMDGQQEQGDTTQPSFVFVLNTKSTMKQMYYKDVQVAVEQMAFRSAPQANDAARTWINEAVKVFMDSKRGHVTWHASDDDGLVQVTAEGEKWNGRAWVTKLRLI